MSSKVLSRRRTRMMPGFNLTPMLDMVFYLLFFFILATKMRDESARLDVRLPASATAPAAADRERRPALTLDAQGRVFFKNRPMLHEELALELAHLAGQGVKEIAIRGDERVVYGRVVEVMDWCKQAGMKTVLLDLRRPATAPGAAPAVR